MEFQGSDSSLGVREVYRDFSVALYSNRAVPTYRVVAYWRSSEVAKSFEIMGYVEGGA
jgi:hypothetical protein